MSTNEEDTRRLKRVNRWLWAAVVILILAAILGFTSCASPQSSQRKAPQTVTILRPINKDDLAAIRCAAAESEAAVKTVVFAPLTRPIQ